MVTILVTISHPITAIVQRTAWTHPIAATLFEVGFKGGRLVV